MNGEKLSFRGRGEDLVGDGQWFLHCHQRVSYSQIIGRGFLLAAGDLFWIRDVVRHAVASGEVVWLIIVFVLLGNLRIAQDNMIDEIENGVDIIDLSAAGIIYVFLIRNRNKHSSRNM